MLSSGTPGRFPLAGCLANQFRYYPCLFLGLLMALPGHAFDLETVYQQALSSDPVYQQSIDRQNAAREAPRQAKALLLPNISLSGYTRDNTQDVSSSESFGNIGHNRFNSHGYQLQLRQTLINLNQYLNVDLAKTTALLATLRQQSAEQALIIRVSERYFNVLAAQDNLKFARAEERSLERQLTKTQQNFVVGLIPVTDVQEAQAGYDQAVAMKILAVNNLDNAREAVHEITDHYPDSLTSLAQDTPLPEPDPSEISHWTDAAMAQNPEILAAESELALATKRIGMEKSRHYPSVDLVAAYHYDRGGGRFGISRQHSRSMALELRLPLYQGGLIRSTTRQAVAEQDEARNLLQQQRRATRRMTREAYLGVISNISQVQAFGQVLCSSEAALHATQAGLEAGTRTTVDVVIAERSVFSARRDYARARYDYILSTLLLKQATGQLDGNDLRAINDWLQHTPAAVRKTATACDSPDPVQSSEASR